MAEYEGIEGRFTVEECNHSGVGIGDWAIRFTPPAKRHDDGSRSIGLSFQALIAGDCLADQKRVLQQVCDILNASPVGRPDTPE